MLIDTNSLVSITEANQDFAKIAKLVDQTGSVVILKDNMPKYVITEYNKKNNSDEYVNDNELLSVSDLLADKNKTAYEVLAK